MIEALPVRPDLLVGAAQGMAAAAVYSLVFYAKKREAGQPFKPYKAAATLVVGAGVGALLGANGVTVTPTRLESALVGYVGTIALTESVLKWVYRRYRNFRKTGTMTLKLATAPWDALRAGYRKLRARYFTVPRQKGRHLKVDATPAEVREALGNQSFAPNWEFSYDKGEVLNLARVVREDVPEHPEITWWQTHVRGWPVTDGEGLLLRAHWEPEPTETDSAHLNGKGYSVKRGMDNLEAALKAADIQFEEVQYDG